MMIYDSVDGIGKEGQKAHASSKSVYFTWIAKVAKQAKKFHQIEILIKNFVDSNFMMSILR